MTFYSSHIWGRDNYMSRLALEQHQHCRQAIIDAQQRRLARGAHGLGSEIELAYAELLAARGAHEQASAHYRATFRHRQRPVNR